MRPTVRAADGALPRCDSNLVGLARPVADHSAALLALGRAWLLSFTISTRPPIAPLTMCWNDSLLPVPIASLVDLTEPAARRSLARFEAAGDQLIAQLVCRWPMHAAPPAIGIVTDGTGVAFSSDYPSPLHPDWLALHQAGRSAPLHLLAFAGDSAWTRLTAVGIDKRTH